MLPSSLIFQTKKKERKKERELNEVSLEEKNDVKKMRLRVALGTGSVSCLMALWD